MIDKRVYGSGKSALSPNDASAPHWLARRVLNEQYIRRAELDEDFVVAVLRGLADFTLWKKAFPDTPSRASEAARFCHEIADDIERAALERENQ